jgi:hypothetical protein
MDMDPYPEREGRELAVSEKLNRLIVAVSTMERSFRDLRATLEHLRISTNNLESIVPLLYNYEEITTSLEEVDRWAREERIRLREEGVIVTTAIVRAASTQVKNQPSPYRQISHFIALSYSVKVGVSQLRDMVDEAERMNGSAMANIDLSTIQHYQYEEMESYFNRMEFWAKEIEGKIGVP